jgi:hypothetical protein
MITWAAILLAAFAASVFYTCYLKAISDHSPVLAGFWSMLITLLVSVIIINYSEDLSLLVPASLGTFLGTWLGIHIKEAE